MDVLLLSVPVLDLQYPPSSPAAVRAYLEHLGLGVSIFDSNIMLYELCDTYEHYMSLCNEFEVYTDTNSDTVNIWLDNIKEKIEEVSPSYVGLSVFSYKSHKACLLISQMIKKCFPNIKVIVGGRGTSSFPFGPDHDAFKDALNIASDKFGVALVKANLAEQCIEGDIDNINGSVFGRECKPPVKSLMPIYDDYDLDKYLYTNNEKVLSVTGSKGCVRKCTFCDIPVLWPKYSFRSGEDIATEMIELQKRHGVSKFYMTDSLVNGSMKAFMDFISVMAKHNEGDNPIKWVGQYITRPSHQIPEGYYELLKKSGGEGLTIGVESGSDNVREHMHKKFSTADIDKELEQFQNHGIVCVLLFFSSYPTETWEDFLDTVNMLIRYKPYFDDRTIWKITLGTPYTHHPDTPLWIMQDDIQLDHQSSSDILWLLEDNKDLTFYERVRRRLILQEVSMAMNIPLSRNAAELNQLRFTLKHHKDKLESYFEKTPISVWPDIRNLTPFDNVLMPLEIQSKLVQSSGSHTATDTDIDYDIEGYLSLKEELGKNT